MKPPSLCIIFEATGPYNAIGKIAMAQAEAALSAGWRVSIVAKRLSESLQSRVEWLKLYVPPRGFALQWLTARHFIRKALGDPSRFDVIHGHQPQVADLCQIYQCHFLTRAAHELNCLLDAHGFRRFLEYTQKRMVLFAEDRCYKKFNPDTHVLFNSALTRDAFHKHYGLPPKQEVFLCPSPPESIASAEERYAARSSFGLSQEATVVGFLGGLHERKGFREVIKALKGHREITLLIGGLYTEGFDAPELKGHFLSKGFVHDTQQFYAACDALVIASHFEPFGLVASEAAARGVPVIATRNVGALPHILEHSAGLYWDGEESNLSRLAKEIVNHRNKFIRGCHNYTTALNHHEHNGQLLERWTSIASQTKKAHS